MRSQAGGSISNNRAAAPSDQSLLIGLDIGGTKIATAVADVNFQILSATSQPTETADPDKLVDSVVTAVYSALDNIHAAPDQIAAVGAGVPGLVDPAAGDVHIAVNLNLHQYPLGETLAARFNAPVVLENDVRMAAVGAYQYVHQQETARRLVYVSIGTGVAAGLVLDGQLYRGANGMAGEIGHIIVDPAGVRCACGLTGCLETIIAGPGIVRQWLAKKPERRGADPVTAQTVFTAARQGDADARQVIQRVGYFTARAIQWLVMTYDADKIVFGGGVVKAGDVLMQPVFEALAQFRAQSKLAKTLLPAAKVQLLPSNYNAATWGAILLAQQALQTKEID